MNIGVYEVVNKTNGKKYIGSSGNLRQRLINQKSFLKTGHPFAITALKGQQINIDDFEFNVIAYTPTVEEAHELETLLLQEHKKEMLYNIALHSNGATGLKRDHKTYSEGAKKQWSDPEQRAKKMANMRGKRQSVTCPWCATVGAGGNMRRYHFEKCKSK